MGISKGFALVLILFFLTSFVTLQPTIVKATSIETNSKYALPDENATIILLNGASFAESNYYVAYNTSKGYVPSSWLFALFSTGDGTTGLTISAHDCNVTITSYNYYLQNMAGYNFKADTWLNYTITGTGTQSLDYSALYNSKNSNPTIYIDGIARQQGNGWNWTNFGITVSGASSEVSIHQEDILYLPPRNAPHLSPFSIIAFIAVTVSVALVIVAGLLVYFKKRKH